MNQKDGIALPNALEKQAKERVADLMAAIEKHGLDFPGETVSMPELETVFLFSEFTASTLIRYPKLLVDLVQSGDLMRPYREGEYVEKVGALTGALPVQSEEELKSVLCKIRMREMIRIAWRDLAGESTLEETLRDLSALAEACVDKGISFLYDKLCSICGVPLDNHGKKQELVVLGMGKLGADELNFSSDIDLIFAYPEDAPFEGECRFHTTGEFFTKMCRNFLKVFESSMAGDILFRVDTRLRPFGANGPLAMSFDALENYYQTQGREWERYALIKARPVAGDIRAGKELLKTLNPFVYRRYFDYGSFDSLRDMKRRITLQVKDKRYKNNIKLGAGGIREIEFFGQVFQLIRGGVEPEFQERKILKILKLLLERECIDERACKELTSAYTFLRNVEHRLQEYRDLQTHDLPEKEEEKILVALSMGFENKEAFYKVLTHHMTMVHAHFSHLFVSDNGEKGEENSGDLKYLWENINDPQWSGTGSRITGFSDPVPIVSLLKSLADHPNTNKLTRNGRQRLDRLMPVLLRKVGKHDHPETVLQRLVDLIITIERRTCYLSLLIEKPRALDNLVTLASKSPWITSFLSQHPALLDELMTPESLYTPPDREQMENALSRRMTHIPVDDFEFQLEELCVFRQVMTLRVAAADISGNYPLMKVSDRLTDLAETVMNKVIEIAWYHTVQKYGAPVAATGVGGTSHKHGRVGASGDGNEQTSFSPGFAAIAYGKLGGIELGYQSDLDMVFIHSASEGFTEGGKRSIENTRFYTFLGQRIINALTLHTQAGILYEPDMRLRPSGQSGMIVSHIDAFSEYIRNEAWTWEHQAIIRARPIAGDPVLRERFNEIRREILIVRREPEYLKGEVRKMRERMRKEHLKGDANLFDLKQGRGGIVDIEFLVQYLVLHHACQHPALTRWTDNVRLIETLLAEKILTKEEAALLTESYLKLRQKVHHLNLQEKEKTIPGELFQEKGERIFSLFNKTLYDKTERKQIEKNNATMKQ